MLHIYCIPWIKHSASTALLSTLSPAGLYYLLLLLPLYCQHCSCCCCCCLQDSAAAAAVSRTGSIPKSDGELKRASALFFWAMEKVSTPRTKTQDIQLERKEKRAVQSSYSLFSLSQTKALHLSLVCYVTQFEPLQIMVFHQLPCGNCLQVR